MAKYGYTEAGVKIPRYEESLQRITYLENNIKRVRTLLSNPCDISKGRYILQEPLESLKKDIEELNAMVEGRITNWRLRIDKTIKEGVVEWRHFL